MVVGCFGGSCNYIKILCNIRLDPTKKKIDYKMIGYDSADAYPKAIYALNKMMNTEVETNMLTSQDLKHTEYTDTSASLDAAKVVPNLRKCTDPCHRNPYIPS